jgi:hypothetical protein
MYYKHFAAGLLLFAGTLLSCKKEKVDYLVDNRANTEASGNSLVRLVNIKGNNQLIINGDTLTNFTFAVPVAGQPTPAPNGTKWFPDNGAMGPTFSIPRQFLQSGKAFVVTDSYVYQGVRDSIGFEVTETNNAPMDYYIVQGDVYTAQKVDRVLPVPRDVTAPARAGYFKIRLLNIADQLKPQGAGEENISQPLTLAYADGTPVSAQTSGIDVRQHSDYIELPYGTYQFKVLTPQGTEVMATGGSANENANVIDPATSQITKGVQGIPHTVPIGLTYAPVRSYQPGGIYTIAVGASSYTSPYYNGQPGETTFYYQHGFRVIADISEPLNATYFRLQGVHALPGEAPVSFRVNGNKLGDVGYSEHSDYGMYVQGKAKIEALNGQGTVIASLDVDGIANQNYTAWLYKKTDGTNAIALASNNLSGAFYFAGSGTDGQDGQFTQQRHNYPFHTRFLNFCADLPYASFTTNNGQAVGQEASRNLAPGQIPVNLPYARSIASADPYQLMVFRSSPTVYPGNWIPEIPVLKNTDFVAKPEHYTRPVKPLHEPGIYTVALIGKLDGTAGQQAKMIIVKHTK